MSPEIDPLDVQAHERDAANAAELAREKQEQRLTDLKWLMSFRQGRRIVWRLLEETGVYRSSFHTNALTMAMLEGQRNHGLRLLAAVTEATPRKFDAMMKENRNG